MREVVETVNGKRERWVKAGKMCQGCLEFEKDGVRYKPKRKW